MSNQNLTIWNQVKNTDPNYVKNFRRAGGFAGTAIDPMYNIFRATQLFGPMGIGWGFEIVNEQIIDGAPLLDSDGNVVGCEKLHEIKLRVWYKHGDATGEIFASGATMMVGRNKNGFFTDEEAVKKSITDALSKALSYLGFSADVHLGRFDSNKYTNPPKATPASKPASSAPANGNVSADGNGQISKHLSQIDGVEYVKQGDMIVAQGKTYGKSNILKSAGFRWDGQRKVWYKAA